ncbi:NAD(+) salvage pathway protein [Lithohypha guttulata]|uniref:nicotinamidase n=1 Tax=Lithohypha guttulata TaxID=1690604 RepID=A0AAN7YLJ6_9EURO|nr:NAD(+) salvage pathway protein [Lithohypha guttulata]
MASVPALVVVDMQNDFCPPNGTLPVQDAKDTLPLINKLLESKAFKYKVATKDWHPPDHVSFAANHPEPNNKPFESFIEMSNLVANKPDEKMQQRLWPVHCVQNTKGAELVPELKIDRVDLIVEKGSDPRVEMYSAFSDSFGNMTAGEGGVNVDLAKVLREKGITHVYCVGIAGDYCLNYTALDSAKAGFKTIVIEEAQRSVDPSTWLNVLKGFKSNQVEVVSEDSDQVQQLLA